VVEFDPEVVRGKLRRFDPLDRPTRGSNGRRLAIVVAFGLVVGGLIPLGVASAPTHGGKAVSPLSLSSTPSGIPASPAIQPSNAPGTVSVVGTVAVGGLPQFATYDAADAEVYVPNWANANVSVVAGTTVVASVPAGVVPFSATYDPANHFVYVVNEASHNVTVIDGTHVVGNVAVGNHPQYATYDPANEWVYVSNSASGTVTAINGTTVMATIHVGTDPSRPVVGVLGGGGGGGGWSPAARVAPAASLPDIWVPNSGSNNVSVIGGPSGHAVLGSVHVGSDPQFATWDPSNVWLYVANNHSGNVSVLSSSSPFQVLYSIPVGSDPWSASYDSGSGEVYVVNYGSSSVSVIGGALTTTVVKTLHVGTWPEFVTTEPAPSSTAFVSNTGSDNVTVLSGSTLVGSLRAGGSPIFGTYDPADGFVYIQNFNTANLTVLGTAYSATFRALGLPSGSAWSVSAGAPPVLKGDTTSGATGSISFVEPAGALNFSIAGPAGFAVSKVTGPGSPSQHAVNLSGSETITVKFGPLEVLTFEETGLLPGTLWGVALTSALPHGGPPGTSATTHGSSLNLTLVSGAWHFRVGTKPADMRAVPAHGGVGVPTHSVTKRIKFKPVAEKWTFHETGLPAGSEWGINLTGRLNQSLSTTHASLSVLLPNGTYHYAAWNFSARHPHAPSGTFVVTAPHSPTTLTIQYTSVPTHPNPGRGPPATAERAGIPGAPYPRASRGADLPRAR